MNPYNTNVRSDVLPPYRPYGISNAFDAWNAEVLCPWSYHRKRKISGPFVIFKIIFLISSSWISHPYTSLSHYTHLFFCYPASRSILRTLEWCCWSDWPGLCLFSCYQPSCVVSQQSWFWAFFIIIIIHTYYTNLAFVCLEFQNSVRD